MLTDQEHETLRQALLKVHRYLAQDGAHDADPLCCGQAEPPDDREKRR
jgi:hypothetical protein